jgi:hypothetical protein
VLVWGTSVIIWLILPTPDDDACGAVGGMRELSQGEPKYSEETAPVPFCPPLGSNPGRRGGKPASKRLSYGTAAHTEQPDGSNKDPCRVVFCKWRLTHVAKISARDVCTSVLHIRRAATDQ